MAEYVLSNVQELLQYLNSKRFKHGLHGGLQASIGAYLARITKKEMAGRNPAISQLTADTRVKAGPNGIPLKDTGDLYKSIVWERIQDGIEVGSNLHYARIHQEGGVIRPVKAKKLAVPWTREARLASSTYGVRGAIQHMSGGKGVWFNEGSIFIHGVLQFLRMKQVTIPKREYLIWNKEREDYVAQMIINFMEDEKL